MRLDPAVIKQQIESLIATYPELADDEVLRADMLEGSTDLVAYLRRLEVARQGAVATAEAIATLLDSWKQRQQRFEHRVDALRSIMLKLLQTAQLKKLELPEATLSVKLGVPRVLVTDDAAVPDEFCRFKREPDRTKIKAALAELKPVPGATLTNAEDVLAVRVR
jgi:hypothetical protein